MKTERILEASLAVMMAAFVGVLYFSLHDNVVKAGDTAPDFSIKTEKGQTVTARDFGGKLLLLNFWATWCPPCIEETPSLNQFAQELAPKGLVVLGVSIDTDQKAYTAFLGKYGIRYQTAFDPAKSISNSFGTYGWPESYLINASGKVVEKFVGPVDWTSEQMIEHVNSLL